MRRLPVRAEYVEELYLLGELHSLVSQAIMRNCLLHRLHQELLRVAVEGSIREVR